MNEKIYDLIKTSSGIQRFAYGKIEKSFLISSASSELIKAIRVRGRDGSIILRYPYYEGTLNSSHNEAYEKFIDTYYERV